MDSPVSNTPEASGAEAATQRALEQVLADCTKQPLDKPHYFLLQRACILSSLSQRVYDPAGTAVGVQTFELQLTLVQLASAATGLSLSEDAGAVPEAKLLSGPQPSLPVHAIWSVKHVGIVVAFRGTADLQDVFTDMDFAPRELSGSNISLHGAVYLAAAQCLPHIQAVYAEAAQQYSEADRPPLFLTGTRFCSSCLLAYFQCTAHAVFNI